MRVRTKIGRAAAGLVGVALCLPAGASADDGELAVLGGYPHLRSGGEREWADWPERAAGKSLETPFAVREPGRWKCLKWRQDGVKQRWEIGINGTKIGTLVADDKDQRAALPIPKGVLVAGDNLLEVVPKSGSPDDIRVGEIFLGTEDANEVVGGALIKVSVKDADGGGNLPSKITIVDESGSLARIGAVSGDRLAVRSGVVYTADGDAEFRLKEGRYTIYAGRGFEYGLARAELEVGSGSADLRVPLEIGREVDTSGWVSCDTHLHSFTYARHGDATFTERLIAVAGEGIELPVSTEHNQHIDYVPEMKRLKLGRWMTPVLGNEVTTDHGHFNIWPVAPGAEPPATKLRPWPEIFQNIFATPGVRVCILNHPADTHREFRPFGSEHFVAITGENRDGWDLKANAVEVINSGALNHDPLEVVRGWIGLLNAGKDVTPVGCSDSHSVSFSIAGQGRTYIRGDDTDPGKVDIGTMADHFLKGKVSVSMGLFADVRVNGEAGAGEATAAKEANTVEVTVRSPSWSGAERVILLANGEVFREDVLKPADGTGGKGNEWVKRWEVAKPAQDTNLVAVALGPGIDGLYWPSKRPYQRESIEFTPYVIAITGAVWIDAEADGEIQRPADHAKRLVAESGDDIGKLLSRLAELDKPTAAHVAKRLHAAGFKINRERLRGLPAAVQGGFEAYLKAVGVW